MNLLVKYGDRVLKLESYPIKIEKELLFLSENPMSDDPSDVTNFIEILTPYITNISGSNLTLKEKFNIIYLLISISSSEKVKFICECNQCKNKREIEFRIDDFLISFDDCKTYHDDIDDYLDLETNLKDLDFNKLKINKINFIKEFKCFNCNEINFINFYDLEILKKSVSKTDISGLYNEITSLVYHGHFDLQSVLNNILPFEREIYISKINIFNSQQNNTLFK